MMKMKKILFYITGLVLMASCQHDVIYEVDYNVTLDEENTYYAGDPVRFNVTGDVDNIVFYSGETGHQYVYRDRFEVSLEAVSNAVLHLDIQARYGSAGALEIYASKDFAGLSGTDGEADVAAVQAMIDGGMQGWTRLDYKDGASTVWTSHDFPMKDYLENLSLAFHWCPKASDATQRTYWINGYISLEMDGVEPLKMGVLDMGLTTVMMNEELDPYHKNKGDGSIRFDNPNAAQIVFQGIGANKLTYALNGWIVSTPAPLNKVSNDRGVAIKNLQNYMHSYEYTWDTPGTYKVTFVGRNENYAASSEEVIEYTVTILERP